MVKHYLRTAFRNIVRQKSYSIVNIAGLAIGLTATIFILIWVLDELSYDRFHSKADRIYRVAFTYKSVAQSRTPHPMAQALVNDFPEVEAAVTMSPIWGPSLTKPMIPFRYKDREFEEKELFSADTTFFEVFDFPMIKGNPKTALKEPYGIVITESMAHKYFGDEDPLGKPLKVNGKLDLSVTGVIRDIPANSHFSFDFLISYITMKAIDINMHGGVLSDYYTWNDFGHYNYIVLKKGADPKQLEKLIPNWLLRYIPYAKDITKDDLPVFILQPITQIHLKSHMVWELGNNGNILFIYIFSSAALLILLIACINFINLATAKSARRAREVGVRKSLGANRRQVISQFLVESIVFTAIAFVISILLVELLMPAFNQLTGKNLTLYYSGQNGIYVITILTIFLVGLLAGSYPAFYLSSFNPLTVLKGKLENKHSPAFIRKGLVIFQFSMSIFLIISTYIVYNQLNYVREKDLGFDKERVLVVSMKDDRCKRSFEALRNSLFQIPGVAGITGASNIPGGSFNNNTIALSENDEQVVSQEVFVDPEFLHVLGIELVGGRNFSRDNISDSLESFIINQAAVRKLNLTDPIDKPLIWYGDSPGKVRGKIIGVVKDFHTKSFHDEISPIIIQWKNPGYYTAALIKLAPGMDVQNIINEIKETWKKFDPEPSFDYSFLDQQFDALYKGEQRMGKLFIIFTVLAFFIASLGLFALAAFSAERKTKEIGIRKVHGSSTIAIIQMLISEYVKLMIIAGFIAWPVTWWVMNKWLSNFAFHEKMGMGVFLVSTLFTIGLALLTVAYKSLQAASSNPVNALRYE